MTATQLFHWRHHARWAGISILASLWLLVTGAIGDIVLPTWMAGAGGALATGLVVWGSVKTKVERLESEVQRRVTTELFAMHVQNHTERFDRIETKLDRVIEKHP